MLKQKSMRVVIATFDVLLWTLNQFWHMLAIVSVSQLINCLDDIDDEAKEKYRQKCSPSPFFSSLYFQR